MTRFYADADFYDRLTDGLAESGSVLKPSDLRPRALVAAAGLTVAALLPAANHEQGEGVPSAPSPARGNSGERHE